MTPPDRPPPGCDTGTLAAGQHSLDPEADTRPGNQSPAPDARPDHDTGTVSAGPAPAAAGGTHGIDADAARWAAMASAQSPALGPAVAGYEIVGKLGEGGMGVVYHARQTSLKRLVALKMIRGGAGASTEVLDRFRAEAEAVARLQHPNIVQVYDVGEHDGCPYYSLEYVAGGNLAAKLGGRPHPAGDAAALLETLARAVHHAHQRGVVHRDLKPANVLLDESGTPKVTDFGLAKRLGDGDSGLTRTVAVMGTPSYMAPEQARGETRAVGPAADVYALGAILFEALTGRPPFVGDSVMGTLDRVLNEEPAPPSRYAPGVPRDLETVCLTCLAKEPARRYGSALALAQDLERFGAGEPILARREGLPRKVWRKLCKRRLMAGLVAALLATGGVTAWLGVRAGADRRATALTRDFEAGIDAADWPAGHRDQLESMADDLRTVDPAAADAARRKLVERAARRFHEGLRAPRVTPADVPGLEADAGWVAARDPDRGRELADALRARLRAWQPVADLAPPFAAADAVFAPNEVRVSGGGLVPVSATRAAAGLPTAVPSAGPARLAVEFAPGWEAGSEAGVALDLPAAPTKGADGGYAFIVASAPGEAAGKGHPPPALREAAGRTEVRILRAGVVLRREAVDLPPGPLRVSAERDGDRLRVQVNDAPPVDFTDLVAPAGGGVFGVVWPAGATLTRLRADALPLPPAASPLEKADDLYARGRFADALPIYEGQGGAEGRCKYGLCLAALARPDDAARAFEPLVIEDGDRWPAVAAVNLWLIRLQQKRYDEAEAAARSAVARFGREAVARHVPDSLRREVLGLSHLPATTYLLPDPAAVRRIEAVLKATELIGDAREQFSRRYNLTVALALIGDDARAVEAAAGLLADLSNPAIASRSRSLVPWVARWGEWVHRTRGRSAAGRAALERLLNVAPRPAADGTPDPFFQTVRIPLARVAAAAGDPAGAERRLDEYLRTPGRVTTEHYAHVAEAWLMKGFLRARAGDAAGAEAAWRAGTHPAFRDRLPANLKARAGRPTNNYELLDHHMLASLSGTMTDEDAAAAWQGMKDAVATDPLMAQFVSAIPVPPPVVRDMWRSDRGRELAGRMAFLDLSAADYFRAPPQVLLYQLARHELFAGSPHPDQDEVLWQCVVRFSNRVFERKMGKTQALQFGLAWGGTTGTLGWAGVAPKLPADTRGPCAYVLGLRLRKLGKPVDAKALFRTAVKDAPAGSPLQRLAREELDRSDIKE